MSQPQACDEHIHPTATFLLDIRVTKDKKMLVNSAIRFYQTTGKKNYIEENKFVQGRNLDLLDETLNKIPEK